jgi:hypothetical protein
MIADRGSSKHPPVRNVIWQVAAEQSRAMDAHFRHDPCLVPRRVALGTPRAVISAAGQGSRRTGLRPDVGATDAKAVRPSPFLNIRLFFGRPLATPLEQPFGSHTEGADSRAVVRTAVWAPSLNGLFAPCAPNDVGLSEAGNDRTGDYTRPGSTGLSSLRVADTTQKLPCLLDRLDSHTARTTIRAPASAGTTRRFPASRRARPFATVGARALGHLLRDDLEQPQSSEQPLSAAPSNECSDSHIADSAFRYLATINDPNRLDDGLGPFLERPFVPGGRSRSSFGRSNNRLERTNPFRHAPCFGPASSSGVIRWATAGGAAGSAPDARLAAGTGVCRSDGGRSADGGPPLR